MGGQLVLTIQGGSRLAPHAGIHGAEGGKKEGPTVSAGGLWPMLPKSGERKENASRQERRGVDIKTKEVK